MLPGARKLMVDVLPTGLVDRANAAAALGRAPKTLANWTSANIGPGCIRIRGRCYYDWSEIQYWAFGGVPHPGNFSRMNRAEMQASSSDWSFEDLLMLRPADIAAAKRRAGRARRSGRWDSDSSS